MRGRTNYPAARTSPTTRREVVSFREGKPRQEEQHVQELRSVKEDYKKQETKKWMSMVLRMSRLEAETQHLPQLRKTIAGA